MTDLRRAFPQTVEAGDLLVAIIQKQTVTGYNTGAIAPGDPADEYKCVFSYLQEAEDLDTERAFIGVQGADFYRFDVPTTDWPPGAYMFRISGEWTRDGVRKKLTHYRGIVEVMRRGDAASDATAHAHSMVLILRQVIKDKLQGTSDISSYTIGGRSVDLVSLSELRRNLRRYEDDLVRLRGGYPAFDTGTPVV